MELYQASLELVACLSLHRPLLVLLAQSSEADLCDSVCHLMPPFDKLLTDFVNQTKMRMGSPDFRLVDFAHKVLLN